jgi:O-antigen/teichoic acid export membrane protein
MQANRPASRTALGSGIVTGLSTAAVSGSAAVAGALLAREFGHGLRTDGFFAAYAVYVALVLVASALRVVVLPQFARAQAAGRLGREVGAWCVAVAVPLVPVVVLALVASGTLARGLAGSGGAQDAAAELLPWLVPAAAAQVYAGIAASGLAALGDYGTAALGFGLGAVVGLVVIAVFVDHGVVAFGWGLAVNGAIALGVPLAVLLRRRGLGQPQGRRRRPGLSAGRRRLRRRRFQPQGRVWPRLRDLVEGVALPFALQGLYLIALRFAAGLGPGDPTTFSYAYLIAALLVAVTATSLALVSSVPLTREGLTPERTARHVVAASWLSLAVVAAAAGVFALAGEPFARWVLGSEYSGGTGAELGQLVVYLAPWMVAAVAVSVTFPLLFVRGRARELPLLALAALAVQVPVEWAMREAFGLAGIAAGMAITTGLVLAVLLWSLGALGRTLRGVAGAAAVCGGLAAVAFLAPSAVLGALAAAAVGLALYAAALLSWRPAGLRAAWAYARALQ